MLTGHALGTWHSIATLRVLILSGGDTGLLEGGPWSLSPVGRERCPQTVAREIHRVVKNTDLPLLSCGALGE